MSAPIRTPRIQVSASDTGRGTTWCPDTPPAIGFQRFCDGGST